MNTFFQGTLSYILKQLKKKALTNFEHCSYDVELKNIVSDKIVFKGEFFPDGENSIIAVGLIMSKLNDFQILGKGKIQNYTLKIVQKQVD